MPTFLGISILNFFTLWSDFEDLSLPTKLFCTLRRTEGGLADADAAVVSWDLLVNQYANLGMAIEFVQNGIEQQFVLKDAA